MIEESSFRYGFSLNGRVSPEGVWLFAVILFSLWRGDVFLKRGVGGESTGATTVITVFGRQVTNGELYWKSLMGIIFIDKMCDAY